MEEFQHVEQKASAVRKEMGMGVSVLSRAILTLLVSPTRFAIEQLKGRVRDYGKAIHRWNAFFRCLMIVSIVGLCFAKDNAVIRELPFGLGYIALWLVPFSRVNELGLAFYRDAFQRFENPSSTTKITPVERLRFLLFSYFEVAAQFGILFFFLPRGAFRQDFSSIIEALYFSTVTITTVGYGDIVPTKPWSQLACMYEVAVGFVLLIFALGSYFTTSLSGPSNEGSAPKGSS